MLEITGNIFNRDSWSQKPTTPEIALCVTTNGVVKANGRAVMGAGRKAALRAQSEGRTAPKGLRFPVVLTTI